ncbi:hypothetical protein CQW23_12440 [Capsicum baccatum]|uniref:DUF4283 domain-containing protein n=1 Tax=Capsicum baccatum TaxID=33114 RepID=A0A2G2WSR0_CAPBA|nr:hypothetical protein CQW23_12440 [Capsicum baccatum]
MKFLAREEKDLELTRGNGVDEVKSMGKPADVVKKKGRDDFSEKWKGRQNPNVGKRQPYHWVGQNSSSEQPSTLSDAIPIGLRAGGSLVFSPAPEIDSAVTGSSELVAFSPDLSAGSKDDCSVVPGVNAMPIACVEVGKGMSRWANGKQLKFGEFLGVIFEGKEDRVLDLLRDIEKVRGLRKGERRAQGREARVFGKGRRTKSPFIFENMWLRVDDFKDRVAGWWSSYAVEGRPSLRLAKKMRLLKKHLREWNKEVFGWVEVKMREIMIEVGSWRGLKWKARSERERKKTEVEKGTKEVGS